MRARDILSQNVQSLLAHAKETNSPLRAIKSVAEQSQAAGGGLTNGTVGRMATAESPVNIDAVGELAEVFGLQPWQLLVENINPKALPRLADSALLSQIKQIVDSAQAATHESSASITAEQQVQRPNRDRAPAVGPALTKAISGGAKKNAGSSAAKAPKPRRGGGR